MTDRGPISGDTYLVGSAVLDITPPVGIHLAGFDQRNTPSTAIYHPLRATALAIDDHRQAVLLVTVEWLGFYEHTQTVRKLITDRVPIDPAHIVLSGTHTHYGPAVRELDRARHGRIDQRYVDTALQRIADCAARAWHNRQPAKLRVGVSPCDVSASRRRPNKQGGVDWAPTFESPYDHELTVLAAHAPDGDLRQIVLSYACHPTCNVVCEIGGDYVGFAVDAIEASHPGATGMFLQGCAGDQKVNARDEQTGGYRRLSTQEVREVGRRVAHAAELALSNVMTPITGPIHVGRRQFDLHTEPLDAALVDEYLPRDDYLGRWAKHMKTQLDAGASPATTVPFEVQAITFGNSLVIATMSAEMVAEYSLRLKRELRERFAQVLPLGYTNDIIGYVSSRRQLPEGGYEAKDSNFWYLRTGPYVESTEQRIIDKVYEAIGE